MLAASLANTLLPMNAADFRELVSGRRRRLTASALRGVLYVGSLGYAAAMRLRNYRYDAGQSARRSPSATHRSSASATSPWAAPARRRWSSGSPGGFASGVRVSIVSRGYGAEDGSRNDKALELEQKLPDVPHLQNVDRVVGASTAIEEFESQVVLLDDGFQHRRLQHNLDIVLLDALEPLGFGHVVPRGTLREPLSGLSRASAVVLSRADRRRGGTLTSSRDRHATRPASRLVRSSPRPGECCSTASARRLACHHSRANAWSASADSATPPDFAARALQGLGCTLVEFREFPDHHNYTRADIDALAPTCRVERCRSSIICTHKDLVKVRLDALAGKPLWAVVVGLEFLAGEAELAKLLETIVPEADL